MRAGRKICGEARPDSGPRSRPSATAGPTRSEYRGTVGARTRASPVMRSIWRNRGVGRLRLPERSISPSNVLTAIGVRPDRGDGGSPNESRIYHDGRVHRSRHRWFPSLSAKARRWRTAVSEARKSGGAMSGRCGFSVACGPSREQVRGSPPTMKLFPWWEYSIGRAASESVNEASGSEQRAFRIRAKLENRFGHDVVDIRDEYARGRTRSVRPLKPSQLRIS